MDGTMKDTTTRAVMLAAVVLWSFATAAHAQPQRATGRRAALAAIANDNNPTAASITARVVVSFMVPSIIPPALNSV